ncbi:MAG: cupin domain-containing protein [Thermodesulfovibrionales bacterium]|nr:cupin domain-containing protein [Thermodesulfovibrionales bacterium]
MKKLKKSEAMPISCDWKAPKNRAEEQKSSGAAVNKIYRHKGNFRWSGVKTEKYKQKDGNWSAIVRNVLIGNHGETAKFHLRYFEIAPGGFSSLERHRHEHVVICIRGKGKVLMGKKSHTINYLDTVYIAPYTVHQLGNPFNELFGFLCIVNAKRDKPKIVIRKS